MALITITGDTIRDVAGHPDNRPWTVIATGYQDGGDGGVITDRGPREVYPVAGVLTFQVESGITAFIANPDGTTYLITTPEVDAELWDVLQVSIDVPPTTGAELLAAAVETFVENNPGYPWDGLADKPFVIAAGVSASAARAAISTLSETEIEALIVSTIAEDSTPADAAAAAAETAVDAYVAELDLVQGDDSRTLQVSDDLSGWELAVEDAESRLALGVDTAGNVYAKLREDAVVPRVPIYTPAHDTAFTVEDGASRMVMQVRGDGSVYIPQLTPDSGSFVTTSALTSGPNIVCFGDSLTWGSGMTNDNKYPALLADLAGVTCYNFGGPGDPSWDIAARSSAIPLMVNVDGNEIPTSGGVTVTIEPVFGRTPAPLRYTGAYEFWDGVEIAGVVGDLTYSDPTYTFTRAESGDAVTVFGAVPVKNTLGVARSGDIHILWLGQNNSGPGDDEPTRVAGQERGIADAKAMIAALPVAIPRYLVMSGTTRSDDTTDALWFAAFGRRYIPIRQLLVDEGLARAEIEATEDDDTDISNDTIPRSLLLEEDTIHLNAAGYAVVAEIVYERLQEMGWV